MQNTSKDFEEAFRDFLSKRVTEDLGIWLLADTEYQRVNAEIEMQEERIKACVHSDECRDFDSIFDRLNSLCGEMEITVAETAYIKGLKDGFRLYSMIMLDGSGGGAVPCRED